MKRFLCVLLAIAVAFTMLAGAAITAFSLYFSRSNTRRGWQNRLFAKDIMGGRADYRRRQDDFFEQVGKPRGMERGETHDPVHIREHLSVQEYKKNTNQLELDSLTQQAEVLRKECNKLTFKNQKLQEMNNISK